MPGGRAFVIYGAPQGTTPVREELFVVGAGGSFGAQVSGAGDLNGDGFADVAVNEPDAGRVRCWLGAATGPLRLATTVTQLEALTTPIHALSGAGDTDGNGLDDLLLGAGGDREVFVARAELPGGPSRGTWAQMGFGESVAGLGDVDGDGLDDVAVGAPVAGQVRVYFGVARGASPALFADGARTVTLTGVTGTRFGASLAGGR